MAIHKRILPPKSSLSKSNKAENPNTHMRELQPPGGGEEGRCLSVIYDGADGGEKCGTELTARRVCVTIRLMRVGGSVCVLFSLQGSGIALSALRKY